MIDGQGESSHRVTLNPEHDANGNYLNYAITAQPITPGTTGQRYFYTDQSGVIRANASGAATSGSTPIS